VKTYQDSLRIAKKDPILLRVLKKYPPSSLLLLGQKKILLPHRYNMDGRLSLADRMIVCNVIASNQIAIYGKWIDGCELIHAKEKLLYSGLRLDTYDLISVKVESLSLYIHFKYKSPLFEKILKTGKLPKR
jgi:hypothetical protein